ncbi:methyltransferase [Polyangium sorediatum]|uniref:Methyltransferase n=1 Tax=Polyangium sorediatum TaxID=889274 RepID=A0ABT6NJI7_9BACT|nr:methyltransferase [Polyangium sorediatum]MDI1428475.1 methyltransferase [Polyangium sorediatum]
MESMQSPVGIIMDLAWGCFHAGALNAVMQLRIADRLASRPKTAEELAAEANAHSLSLYRVLRVLASKGVFAEDDDGRFHLTPSAELLRTGVPFSLQGVVQLGTLPPTMEAALHLPHTVKTGECAFDFRHGVGFFEYMSEHPSIGEVFDKAMAGVSDADNRAIAEAYDFGAASRVVDVGGGLGGLLVEVLRRYPSVRGVLYDRLEVVGQPGRIAAAGLDKRVDRMAGDFFTSVPDGADVYVLKRIIHDWADDTCMNILKHCRRAMVAGGRVLVVDALVPPGNTDHPSKALDLCMLTVVPGRERTEAEFAALFHTAGLKIARVIPTANSIAIVEGIAA